MGTLENFRRLMASFDEATMKQLDEEFQRELADPNFQPEPIDIPENAGPFGMTLQQTLEADSALREDVARQRELERARLTDEVHRALESLAKAGGQPNLVGEILNRQIVDEVEHRIDDVPLDGSERLLFLELIAEIICELISERAQSAIALKQLDTDETVKDMAVSSTTVKSAERNPQRIMNRLRSLDSLTVHDKPAAQLYRLAEFAGQTPEEIAELLGLSSAVVLERLKWAIADVTLNG